MTNGAAEVKGAGAGNGLAGTKCLFCAVEVGDELSLLFRSTHLFD